MKRLLIAVMVVFAVLAIVDRASQFLPPCMLYPSEQNYNDPATQDYCATREGIIIAGVEFLYDLKPEVWTALATLAIAIFTLALKLSTDKLWDAGERQIGLIDKIFKKQSIDMVASLFVADTSAKAAEKSAQIAEKALTEIERAFVFIDGFNTELFTDPNNSLDVRYFAIQPLWENAGNTQTTVHFKIDWRGPHPSAKQEIGDYRGLEKGDIFLAPRAVQGTNFFEATGANALIAGGLGRGGDDESAMMLIWGRGDYTDVFGKPHFIEWCYRVRFDRHTGENLRAQLIQWGNYNRSD